MKSILVVPTNRHGRIVPFLKAWEPYADWDEVIIVEDAPMTSVELGANITHLTWENIDLCKEDAWIFSRHDSAIRCFGFLVAKAHGADLIITLDDDCLPSPGQQGGFCAAHVKAMGPPRWVSTLDIPVRGLPYYNLGTLNTVKINVGLWLGVVDQDAPHRMVRPVNATKIEPKGHVVGKGVYVPMCGMNLAFWVEALPLMYFPLMGKGQPFSRFDDIWCGVIAKRICDHLGWSMTIGDPVVQHDCQSDPLANLVKEAPGIVANETFWEMIDAIPLTAKTPAGCVAELGLMVSSTTDSTYFRSLGRALEAWARLIK